MFYKKAVHPCPLFAVSSWNQNRILFSDAIAQPASVRCSSRVWVFPTSILQSKISRCIYVCIACNNYEASQRASQIWKSFCKSDRPFSSSTWSGRLLFLRSFLRLHPQQAGRAGTTSQFLNSILQIRLQKHLLDFAQTRYSAQNCAGYTFPLIPNKPIFLDKNLFYENRRWFIQYCIKPELLLPVLKVKSGSNAS